ncbi:MAG: NAD(P)/FAD-dependent oxidoreductase [Bacteroidetes bacterium]|nr:NAD(P)/FAD-dependent oxidoreductase [Bacteroidota bacterium]MCL5026533.1 NAD(P)/FAD-dependent oxidoreductase [Chloroflexota bacterium]
MAEKSVIIIGAGLAGLSVGCYAQMNGYRSHIFEHHSLPGGVATAWKRDGYTIDGGIHFLWGHKPGSPGYALCQELRIPQSNPCVDLEGYRYIDESTGRTVDIGQDLDGLADRLKALSPADSGTVDELVAGARDIWRAGVLGADFGTPPELAGPLGGLKQMWGLRRVLKYFTGQWAQPVERYVQGIHDPCLRRIVENIFLPEVPVWFALMLLGMLGDRQLGLLEEGSLHFALSVERRYKEMGGEATYKARVKEILVEDDRAVGVRLIDGSQHRADIVVSAADGYSTIFEMLGGRYIDARIEDRYRNWKLFRPMVMISFGLARAFVGEPPMSFVILRDPFEVGAQAIGQIFVRVFNYSSKFAPPGRTLLQASFETEWDYWSELRAADHLRYDAEKERVAADVLRRLEAHYPGISSQVEMTDVATPFITWRYTRNYKGAFEGWLPTPEAITTSIARTLPGLANFYMAGQWVMPGGGVLPCLASGRQAAQIICRRDGKPFVASY